MRNFRGLADRSHERFTRVRKLRDELPNPFDSAAQRLYLAATVRRNGALSPRLDCRAERKLYLVDMVVPKPIVSSAPARQLPREGPLMRSPLCAGLRLDNEIGPRDWEPLRPLSEPVRSHDTVNGVFSFAVRNDACRPVPHLAVGRVGGTTIGGPTIRPPFAPESAAATGSITVQLQNCKPFSGERVSRDQVTDELESMWQKLEAAEDPDRLEAYLFPSTNDVPPLTGNTSSRAAIDVTSRVNCTTKAGWRRIPRSSSSSLSKRDCFAPLRVQGGQCNLKRESHTHTARDVWVPNTKPSRRPSSASGPRTTVGTRLRPATALPSQYSSTDTVSLAVEDALFTSVPGQVIRDSTAPRV